MAGESKLSTELSGGLLTGIHHDQQTRDIRNIEIQAEIFSAAVVEQTTKVSDVEDLVADIDNRTKTGFNTIVKAGGMLNAMTATFGGTVLKENVIYAIECLIHNNSTLGIATLNIDGLGVKPIVKGSGIDLVSYDLSGPLFVALFRYVASVDKFFLLNPAGFSHNGLNITINNLTANDLVVDDIIGDVIQAATFQGDGSQLSNVKWQGSSKTVSVSAPINTQGVDGDVWFQVAP